MDRFFSTYFYPAFLIVCAGVCVIIVCAVVCALILFFSSLCLSSPAHASAPWEANTFMRVVCDGAGGMSVATNPAYVGEDNDEVTLRCDMNHELEHIAFIGTYWPDVCAGKIEGDVVNIDPQAAYLTECMAYAVSMNCFARYDRRQTAVNYWNFAKHAYGCNLRATRKSLDFQRKVRDEAKKNPDLTPVLHIEYDDGMVYKPVKATTYLTLQGYYDD